MNFHDLVFYSKHHYRFECGEEIGGGAAKRAIRIQDSISSKEEEIIFIGLVDMETLSALNTSFSSVS